MKPVHGVRKSVKRNTKSIISGFYLYQPWAVAVVEGRLPVLVRAQPIQKRERVAVIANEGIDGKFLFAFTDEDLFRAEKAFRFSCILGSVEIVDCVPCKPEEVRKKMIELAGKKHWTFYPKHMLPTSEPVKDVYLWVFERPIKLRSAIPYHIKSIGWGTVKLTKSQLMRLTHKEKSAIPSFWED